MVWDIMLCIYIYIYIGLLRLYYIDDIFHNCFWWYTFRCLWYLCSTTCQLWMDLCTGRIGWCFLLSMRLRVRLYWEGIDELTGRVTWGCHNVITWLTHANTSVGQYYFYVLTTYIYYCFLNVKQTQKNIGGL